MSFSPTHRICRNVVNMYGGPSSSEELVSQAVMGAPVEVLDEDGLFTRIRTKDRYSGWVISRWLAAGGVAPPGFDELVVTDLIADLFETPSVSSRLRTKLPLGASVYAKKASQSSSDPQALSEVTLASDDAAYVRTMSLGRQAASTAEAIRCGNVAQFGREVAQYAQRFVGIPYLWGGSSPFGLDCSGFVQLVWRMNGLLLPRDAHLQHADLRFGPVEEGSTMALTALMPGDLVFFGRRKEADVDVTHVGLAIGDGAFVHSAGGGRGNVVSPCTDPAFAGSFLGATRLLPDADHSIDTL